MSNTEPIHIINNQCTILWEALVRHEEHKKGVGQLLMALGKSACMGMQEIGISPCEDGWIIHIRACSEDGHVDVLIPRDPKRKVEVLEDTRATSQPYGRFDYRD